MILRPGDHAPEWDCGLGDLEPSSLADKLDSIIWLLEDVRNLLVNTASAAPGVSPVEAADNGPGVAPPIPTPGPLTSPAACGPLVDLHNHLKAFGRKCVLYGDMTPSGEQMLLRILAEYCVKCGHLDSYHHREAGLIDPCELCSCTDYASASVHDRTMRQRHNEDREQ